ncbi:MAG: head GIN domain-containing protein [Betaproteobacteria bacterium]
MNPDHTRRGLLRAGLPLLLPAAALLPSAAWAQRISGSGRAASEMRSLPAFQGVTLSGAMDLVARQGPSQAVEVQADDNLLPLIETEVSGSGADARLQVRWKRGVSIYAAGKVRVIVTVPVLTALTASGSGNLLVEPFETPSLAIRVSGSSDVRLRQLNAGDLQLSISGSGDVAGAGRATTLKIAIAGSGDVQLRDLKADDVTIDIAGSGDASVHADKSLRARIAGSGDVIYTGNAARVDAQVSGSGSVKKR